MTWQESVQVDIKGAAGRTTGSGRDGGGSKASLSEDIQYGAAQRRL